MACCDHWYRWKDYRGLIGSNEKNKITDSFEIAEKIIDGIETTHMIRKEQVEEIQCAPFEVNFFNKIMGIFTPKRAIF